MKQEAGERESRRSQSKRNSDLNGNMLSIVGILPRDCYKGVVQGSKRAVEHTDLRKVIGSCLVFFQLQSVR